MAHTTWNQKSESQVSAKSLNGIYVEKADEFAPKMTQNSPRQTTMSLEQ